MLEFGMIILNLLVFVIILGSIIAIHELGHLIFAKKLRFYVLNIRSVLDRKSIVKKVKRLSFQ